MNYLDGTYRFFLDDKLIHEEKNALTTVGRSIIIKSLLGIIPNFANAIGYGIGGKENTIDPSTNLITDNSLQFEIGKVAVGGSSLSLDNGMQSLIYSGVIQDTSEYFIYEVGLFPSNISDRFLGIRSTTLFSFNGISNFSQFGTASGTYMSTNSAARIGSDMVFVPNLDGSTGYLQYNNTSGELNILDTFTSQDVFKLAGFNVSSTSSSVIFRMHTDDSSYYELLFNTPSASGYFISEKEKFSVSTIGTPQWSNISYVRFWQTGGAGGILLDGLKINTGSYFIDTNTGMISRAVLSTPIRKPATTPLTIEYTLNVGFNEGF